MGDQADGLRLLMKEINKNTREGTMVLKDVTNGTEFLVKAV